MIDALNMIFMYPWSFWTSNVIFSCFPRNIFVLSINHMFEAVLEELMGAILSFSPGQCRYSIPDINGD